MCMCICAFAHLQFPAIQRQRSRSHCGRSVFALAQSLPLCAPLFDDYSAVATCHNRDYADDDDMEEDDDDDECFPLVVEAHLLTALLPAVNVLIMMRLRTERLLPVLLLTRLQLLCSLPGLDDVNDRKL